MLAKVFLSTPRKSRDGASWIIEVLEAPLCYNQAGEANCNKKLPRVISSPTPSELIEWVYGLLEEYYGKRQFEIRLIPKIT